MENVRARSYDRLSVDTAALVMVDHQAGLFSLVRDSQPDEFLNAVLALADIGRLFKLPAVVTTSNDAGPNGPLMPGVRERLPKARLVRRPGEINAWDNPEFVKAVKKTGRNQLIVAGITTDVCVALVTLSALAAGFEVFVVADASGAMSVGASASAMARVTLAGAQPMTWFAVASELMRDWRNDEAGLTRLMSDHVPAYRNLIASHG